MTMSKPSLRPVTHPPTPAVPGGDKTVPTGTWSGVNKTDASRKSPGSMSGAGTGSTTASGTGSATLRKTPLLASSVLWEDFAPKEPGHQVLRQTAIAVGVVGTAATLVLSWQEPAALLLAALFALLGLLGVIGLSYALRAASIVPVAFCGLLGVSWVRTGLTGLYSGPWLAVGVAVLSASLYFRAYYRSSKIARLLVGAGILVCAGWLFAAGHMDQLAVLDLHWQSWLKPMMWLGLALLLLLSLLAFMEARTTGGCKLWATALLGWYAIYVTLEWALQEWPAPQSIVYADTSRTLAPTTPPVDAYLTGELLSLSVALLAVISALSLWQLLASVYSVAFQKQQNEVSVKLLADKGLR